MGAGKNKREAYESFVGPLKRAISCVAKGKVVSTADSGEGGTISLSPAPFSIPGSPYSLFITHSFHYVPYEVKSWRVSSLRYEYAIEVTKTGQEIVAFHWEGFGNGVVPYPHLHTGVANELTRKAHLPTGRVPLEDVIYFLISDLGIPPLQKNWQEILQEAKQPL